ncbi:helix-turn-helix transcriptional regulator [Streptomyces canus]|uniref:Transcriptional regulator with XRE-family HTH domain n=1 Tax=Streptomyces canus TaxID=58343 RepID=A0AAW8FJZ5_9ACTN|nr:helix-turn-helix transcriptional regulator [Streptomyces canus]MDQ0910019.1 transcriptional regulator with XRE-family HTH domain [Streptomyces canus]MDQ1070028.1 transcriptional regulator with XRE-family HTH domain [Streptomyces canus]
MNGDLGDFLRSRRARIRPEEVGLPSHGRRRVPGLRREEVAQLAGVSVDYYIRLEQGRGPSVSEGVLDAVARVLRLDETEHAYLRTVARPTRKKPGPRREAAPRVRPGVQLLLDSMDRTPAFVLGPRMDVLAWNALADALSGYSRMAPARRNIVRQLFLEPEGRDLYPDFAAVASQSVAHLRLNAGAHPDDPALRDLVGELSLKSEDFRRLWADHQVKACMYGVKRVRHPVAGLLTLPYESLVLPETPDRTLVAYTPEPGSETAERLALLGSWTSTSA